MISNRWQRRIPRPAPEGSGREFLSGAGEKIRSFIKSAMFESIDPGSPGLPAETNDNGPFGMVGPNGLAAIKDGLSVAGRTAASPFGALVTIMIADGLIRVLTARGNRVRAWAEAELPTGVVQDGLIVDEQTFIKLLSEVLGQITRNGKLSGQKVAIAITGRNMVQRRLTVYIDDDQEMVEAIIAASTESMSIHAEEMQIEWDAEELDLVGPDEEALDEDEDEVESEIEGGDDAAEDEGPDSLSGGETGDTTAAPAGGTEELGLENLDLEPEPEGRPYDVYALALHRHVIRRNLRTVSDFGSRFAGVQPKILALSAAINSRAAIILDVEANKLMTALIGNGLPEVIREVGIDPHMNRAEWVNLITTQISRAVAFYDSIFPGEPFESNVDVFVTGQSERAGDAIDEALDRLPFVRSELPQTLRAPVDFPFDRYAANVGLVIVSGKRFWQRAPVPLLPTPRFDYRPAQYRPRPLPWRAALKVAATVILGLGVVSSFNTLTAQSETVVEAEFRLGIIERQVDLRRQKLNEIREARTLLNQAQARTERLLVANLEIQDRAAGFAETMSVITAVTPPDVFVTTVDDDGRIVAVEAEAAEYSLLLAFIKRLDEIPQFVHVQILNLGRASDADGWSGLEPAVEFGGATAVGSGVKMSVEITRIELDEGEERVFPDEELAVAGGQGR